MNPFIQGFIIFKHNNMVNEEVIKLANAWIKLTKLAWEVGYTSPKVDELYWASEEMIDLVSKNPYVAWDVILTILKIDESIIIMANLSAGPLEDLLAYHGEDFIVLVETEARKNPMFAILLGGVWKNGMKEDVWNRVQAACNRAGWQKIDKK